MAITHKGMSMLLKHHALDATKNTDDDVKNCVDADIKNSDTAVPEESEEGEEGEGAVENRSTDETVAALQKQVETLTKELRGKKDPVHNRNTARVPEVDVDLEPELLADGQAIANRAAEIQKLNPGMSQPTAFVKAAKELEKAAKK